MSATAEAYLALPADERFEARIPSTLKRHAESIARARGESLSQYVLKVLAEQVATDLAVASDLALTPPEQVELLRVLASPPRETPALGAAIAEANALWGTPAT